jgi:zinc/manganese transport system substrate-binding protein
MKRRAIPTCAMGVLILLQSSIAYSAEVKVVATVPDLAWIVEQVGGDRVEVKSICKGYQDPHYLAAKPSYTKHLRKADLLVFVGLELEVAWLPQLLEAARNPGLRPGSDGLLEASGSVPMILEIPPDQAFDRSQGDIHPFGNPHYLLDPRNVAPIGESIAITLTVLDPGGGEVYKEGAARLRKLMRAHLDRWEEMAEPLRGTEVVAFHKQWEYLASWLELEIIDYVENRPGVPSSPRHVEGLITRMKGDDIQLVLAAPFVDVHAAEEVARRAGARLVILPAAVGAEDEAETYPELVDLILARLLDTGL